MVMTVIVLALQNPSFASAAFVLISQSLLIYTYRDVQERVKKGSWVLYFNILLLVIWGLYKVGLDKGVRVYKNEADYEKAIEKFEAEGFGVINRKNGTNTAPGLDPAGDT